MIYHYEFDIAAIFVTLFISYYIIFKKGLRRHANRVYFVMLLLALIAEISDIFGSVANNHPEFSSRFIQDFWNYVYLISHNMLAFAFVLYLFYLLGYEKSRKAATVWLCLPALTELGLFLSNPFHHQVFYYDENGTYLHGRLFIVIYGVAVAYMIFAIYLTLRHRKALARGKSRALLFFILISFVPIMLQIAFPQYLLSLFFESLGLMGILFTIENKDDIINPTTGILNRYALQLALDEAMRRKGNILLLIKIPNLNYYNKMIGFENMNGILERISDYLEKEFKNHSCYDCGRGHFAVLCEDIIDWQVPITQKKIFERFEKPWGKGKFSLAFPVQFGVIHLPEDVNTMENLFMIIDASFDGKESCVLDVAKTISDYERRVLVEGLIDKALKNKSFQVFYQPIYNIHTGRVQSAEALCRLFDEEYGSIAPDEFIPIAEQNGSILEIGRFVFEEVCRFYQEGRLKDLGVDYVEVNLSVVQCMSRNLRETFDDILKKYNLDAGCINLEITESATVGEQNVLVDTITNLSKGGFTFSLDDYGTGYSNITYMYDMPFSIIKIDKSILWKAMHPITGEGQHSAVIYLENTVRMLQEMNYSVLVEGVETLEQKMLLERLECDYLQGYYFSKPIQKRVFADYLKVVNA